MGMPIRSVFLRSSALTILLPLVYHAASLRKTARRFLVPLIPPSNNCNFSGRIRRSRLHPEDLFKSAPVDLPDRFGLVLFPYRGVYKMSDQTVENKALMRRIYEEMWNQAQPSLAAEIFDRPGGVARFVLQFLVSFPDLQHTVEEMIAEDDRVAVRFRAVGTHQRQWLQFAPTGISIQYTGVTLARIAGGRIVEHHTWWDKAGLMQQIAEGKL
jgi:predicted ester cyclase